MVLHQCHLRNEIGGSDANGAPTNSNYWTVPNATTGDITTWTRTDSTDMLTPRAGAAVAAIGSTQSGNAGVTPTRGPVRTTLCRDALPYGGRDRSRSPR